MRGIVLWFNDKKGYGFVRPDETEDDVFIHFSSIKGKGYRVLAKGDIIEFDIQQMQKGNQAFNVKKIRV